jgi:CRP-like cAMP-binding protein
MKPEKNFREYRAAIVQSAGKPWIPYLGLHLTDLTFVDDGNTTWIGSNNNLVNLQKAVMSAQAVRLVVDSAKIDFYGIRPMNSIQKLLSNVTNSVFDENEVYRLSLLREARNAGGDAADRGRGNRNRLANIAKSMMKRANVAAEKELTGADWQVVLEGARTVLFNKDQTIIKQGQHNLKMYMIQTGRVRVEKTTEGKPEPVVLTVMEPPKVFGEMSIIMPDNKPAVSCVADVDGMRLYETDYAELHKAFTQHPDLARRFYMTMAKKLSEMLIALVPPSKKKEEMPAATAAAASSSSSSGTSSSKSLRESSTQEDTEEDSKEVAQSASGSSSGVVRKKKKKKKPVPAAADGSAAATAPPSSEEKIRRRKSSKKVLIDSSELISGAAGGVSGATASPRGVGSPRNRPPPGGGVAVLPPLPASAIPSSAGPPSPSRLPPPPPVAHALPKHPPPPPPPAADDPSTPRTAAAAAVAASPAAGPGTPEVAVKKVVRKKRVVRRKKRVVPVVESADALAEEAAKYCQTFGFVEGADRFIARYDAVFKKYEGKLVVFEKHVCFLSEMFMTTTKRIYPLARVQKVERRSDGICLSSLSTDLVFTLPQAEAGEAAHALIADLWQKCERVAVDMTEEGIAQDMSKAHADDLFEESQKKILTATDWDLMLNGAKKVVYKDGEFIIRSGDSYQKIYHIIRGNCIVEVERDGQMIVINRMQENTTFGEMSFIKQTEDNEYKASANVVAVDEVEISIIEGYFLNILFDMHPGLEVCVFTSLVFAPFFFKKTQKVRFFEYLCSVLANRIHKQTRLA